MVMRLSEMHKKKCIFCLFLSLHRTVSQPYRLSHINALQTLEIKLDEIKSIDNLIYSNVDEYPRWAQGPELNEGRLYHAAGTIRVRKFK